MSTVSFANARPKPRIVDDLIPVILESSSHWWPRDFQRLALVSTAWVGPIRRRLYACPELRSFQACTLFARTISQNQHIRSLVRGVDLRPAVPPNERPALTERDMAGLRFILNLDGIESLTIGGELAVQAERFIQMMSNTRSLISLHVDGSYIQDQDDRYACTQPASLEWNESIAYRFTKLRTLRLTNLQLDVAEPSIPYALRINTLFLNDVTVPFGSIQNLCHESWQAVRNVIITTKSTESSDEFVRDLLECCENLESVRYEACCAGAHGDIFEEDLPLTSLRKLSLFDIDVHPQTLAVIGRTCTKLERLSILGRSVRLTSQDWNTFISSGALPALKVLKTAAGSYQPASGFSRWSGTSQHQLVASCAARKIDLQSGA
ncbi:hypothetical protein BDW22DRAFT_1366651 [Trametopsis cervina]|nr:hypothetical protein BDW22DRAFT_1366651 [Trametopsis cervina]